MHRRENSEDAYAATIEAGDVPVDQAIPARSRPHNGQGQHKVPETSSAD